MTVSPFWGSNSRIRRPPTIYPLAANVVSVIIEGHLLLKFNSQSDFRLGTLAHACTSYRQS